MASRLTGRRAVAIRDAAVRPSGSLHPLLVPTADIRALVELGLAAFLDDCGHQLDSPDPEQRHRAHPHTLRLTAAGRSAAQAAGGPLRAQRNGRPLPPLVSEV
ncbi:hypothetical protein [Streptomyces nigrescens]|uniref:hypothetical protein n=1 Tax=Streptomyces nigrescens TaxID=1920 RepID=UPI0036FE8C49